MYKMESIKFILEILSRTLNIRRSQWNPQEILYASYILFDVALILTYDLDVLLGLYSRFAKFRPTSKLYCGGKIDILYCNALNGV